MKKIIIILGVFLCLFLVGCDPEYECQIHPTPTGIAPCDFVGKKVEICQIRDSEYDIKQGIPEECNDCLERSGLLDEDNYYKKPIPRECIKIYVAHSLFQKKNMTPEERIIK